MKFHQVILLIADNGNSTETDKDYFDKDEIVNDILCFDLPCGVTVKVTSIEEVEGKQVNK